MSDLAARWNLSPQAAAYLAKTMDEEPPAPEQEPSALGKVWDVVSGEHTTRGIKNAMSPEDYAKFGPQFDVPVP